MGNATHTKGTGSAGVTGADEARLNDGGLLAVGGGGLVSSRTGVLVGPGATSLVSGTSSTGTMRYSVAPHHWVTNRGVVSDGVYRGAAETAKLVDTTAAPGTGSRIDIVYVKQNDAGSTITADATSAPVYGCVQGNSSTGTPTAPTLPVGAEELARATVLTGATRTDDGTKVTISQTAKLTTGRGGVVPIRAASELAGLPAYPTAQALELDTGRLRWHDGTRWRYDGDEIVGTAAGRAALADGYAGLRFVETDTGRLLRYSGSAWTKYAGPAEVLLNNGNTGSSGQIAAGGSAFVLNGSVVLPFAADTVFFELQMVIKSTGSNIGSADFYFNGPKVTPPIFNVDTAGHTVVIAGFMPTTPAGTINWSVGLNNTAGASAIFLHTSSARVTM